MKATIEISDEFPSYVPGRLAFTRASGHVIIQTKPYCLNREIVVDATPLAGGATKVFGICRRYRIIGMLAELFLVDSYCNQCNNGLFSPVIDERPNVVLSIVCPACLARYSRIGDVWASGIHELYIKISDLYH